MQTAEPLPSAIPSSTRPIVVSSMDAEVSLTPSPIVEAPTSPTQIERMEELTNMSRTLTSLVVDLPFVAPSAGPSTVLVALDGAELGALSSVVGRVELVIPASRGLENIKKSKRGCRGVCRVSWRIHSKILTMARARGSNECVGSF